MAAWRSIRAPRVSSRIGPRFPGAGCPVDGLAGRGRRRDQDDRGALAAHAQRPVAVLRAEVADVRAGGFEDPAATPRPGQNGAGPAE
jgi:hypothetical protein